MKKFWVDFSASVAIEAETMQEARNKLFELNFSVDTLEFMTLDRVEEIEEEEDYD